MRSPLIHFLTALAVGIAVSAGYIVWYGMVSEKSRQVAELESQIIDANKNVSRIALARAALAEIANDEESVRGYFVSEAGVVAFINSLEQLGLSQKAAVSVLSVSTGGSPSAPTLLFTLAINGTFDAVMRTVGAIEYAPYDLSISKLGVSQGDKDGWHADVSLIVGSAPVATTTVSRTK